MGACCRCKRNALRSWQLDTQTGQLDIISPIDPTPIVTWDRNKMRQTGCFGNMIFIEIGRRYRGGPDLVWMFAGPGTQRNTAKFFIQGRWLSCC